MTAKIGNSAATGHFGRQMKKERTAHGWTLKEFADQTGVDFTTLSRIENGKRPPNEGVADACDRVFPARRGWFREYYEESRTWMPAGFRDWSEYEDKTTHLSVWSPSVIDGLVQTEDYARGLLVTSPGATAEIVTARLAGRMERQRRVLHREDPPVVGCIVDHPALYRLVGSPEIMAAQMRHLASIAAMPNVTLQILPAVAHPAGASGCMIADNAGYAEHLLGGYAFTEPETVTRLESLFATIRAECYRASESLSMLEGMADAWDRLGGNRPTPTRTAVSASKSRRTLA